MGTPTKPELERFFAAFRRWSEAPQSQYSSGLLELIRMSERIEAEAAARKGPGRPAMLRPRVNDMIDELGGLLS